MTLQDLYAYRVRTRAPLETTAFGYRWVTAPPPSAGGFTMVQSLSILEQAAGTDPSYGAPLLHAMAESWKGPFRDRQRYFGDPDQVILPLDKMMARHESQSAPSSRPMARPTERRLRLSDRVDPDRGRGA